MLASRALSRGEAAFSEAPLCSLQKLSSRRSTAACASCLACLGSPDSQLALLCGSLDRSQAPSALPCPRGCGELFCSATCLAESDASGHALLCVGRCETVDDPLYRFKLHALELDDDDGEALLLAAQLLARSASTAAPASPWQESALCDTPGWPSAARFDSETLREAASGGGEPVLRAALEEALNDAWLLLRAGLPTSQPGVDDAKLTWPRFSAAVTLAHLRSVDAERPSPILSLALSAFRGVPAADRAAAAQRLCEALPAVTSHAASERAAAAAAFDGEQEATESIAKPSEDFDDCDGDAPAMLPSQLLLRRLLPPLRGLCLFPALCGVRHSCAPNCVLTFDDADSTFDSSIDSTLDSPEAGPLRATLRPTCALPQGAELTRSWIDETEDLEQRSAALDALRLPSPCPCELCAVESGGVGMSSLHVLKVARDAAARGAQRLAEAAFRLALSRLDSEPGPSGEAQQWLAFALLNQGRWKAAEAAFIASGRLSPFPPAPCAAHPPMPSRRIAMQHRTAAPTLALSPALSPAACAAIVAEAEAAAVSAGGWGSARHVSVPTTDIPLASLPGALSAFNAVLRDFAAPLAASAFSSLLRDWAGQSCDGAASGGVPRLRVHDAFLVRYDAVGGQRSLPMHRDQGQLSLTLSLSLPGVDFDGGGTAFEGALEDGGVGMEQGQLLLFPSELVHGGAAIARGRRYVIAAFLWVDWGASSDA